MTKIAVITSVYNGEKFIKDCIKSVAASVVDHDFSLEHIIIDNGSTDGTQNILQKHTLSRLKKLRVEKNIGVSAARNLAVNQLDADYLFCLDADDVLLQHSLSALFEIINERDIEWVYGDFLRVDENLSYHPGQDYYGHQFENAQDLLSSIFAGEHFFQQNCLYSKRLFDEVGGFDERMSVAEDLDLFIRFAIKGHNPRYVPGPLYLHRLHKDNASKVLGRENNLQAHQKDIEALRVKYDR